jgi:hypothetical protein
MEARSVTVASTVSMSVVSSGRPSAMSSAAAWSSLNVRLIGVPFGLSWRWR